VGKGGEGRRREGRAGEGKFAPAPSKYIWIDAAGYMRLIIDSWGIVIPIPNMGE